MIVGIRSIKVERADSAKGRARQDFGDLDSLAKSIKQHGQLQPILVDTYQGTDETYKWILVAGERRLRACILAGLADVEIKQINTCDGDVDILRKEIELEENVIRKDLSWQEQAEALRQLDELKRQIHGSAVQSHESKGWSLKDTAEAIGVSVGKVTQDINLAKDLREHPEWARQTARLPKHAAAKVVRQEKERARLKRQIDSKQLMISADLRLGNCCQLIDDLDDESVHMLLTDPPFALPNISTQGGMFQYNLTKTNVDTEANLELVYRELIPKLYKKLVPGAHVYMFLGLGWYHRIITMFRDAGFLMDDLLLIWPKMRVSMISKDMHYMSSYESILYGYKPPACRTLRKPVANVLKDIPAIPPQMRTHSLQKPFDLLKLFINNSSSPGEIVLDCFAGSAATLIAARKLERSAIGFEIDEPNFLRAQDFMSKELEK